MLEQRLRELFSEAGFDLSGEEVRMFLVYLDEIKRWNRVHNLTAVRDEEEIVRRHFIDSLSLAVCFSELGIEWEGKDLADVGSGAGFPGVPLKIYLRDFNLFLIESVGKKCSFLEFLKVRLNLGWEVICRRAEDVSRRFDIVVARAFGKFEEVAPVLESLSRGLVFVMKGRQLKKEWTEKLGYRVYRVRGPEESYILWKEVR